MKKIVIGIAVILLALFAAACAPRNAGDGAERETPDNASVSGEDSVLFVSPDFGEKTLTVAHIKTFPVVEKVLTRVDGDGNEEIFPIKGALLADILESMDKNQQALSGVRLVGGDGYMIEVPEEILAVRDVILAYEIHGEPLGEGVRPLRAFIPDERAMYWVRNLVRVELLGVREEQALTSLTILETVINDLEHHSYTADDRQDLAVDGGDLFKDAAKDMHDTIFLKAADGFEKNEKTSVFQGGFIRFTGPESPAFVDQDLPRGMHVRDILWMSRAGKGFISAATGLRYFPAAIRDGRGGISLAEVFDEVSFKESAMYLFTGSGGESREIGRQQALEGLLYIGDENEIVILFADNTEVRGLLSIEAVVPGE